MKPIIMKRMFYHGTNHKNMKAILKCGFFKEYTYFTNDMADAVTFGGEYVFMVWFDYDGRKRREWQWRCRDKVPTSDIGKILRIEKKVLLDNVTVPQSKRGAAHLPSLKNFETAKKQGVA